MDNSGLILAVICVLLGIHQYLYRKKNPQNVRSYVGSKNRSLILTAHPDDECMFFTPTILSLKRSNEHEVFLLCLSTGNFYRLGDTRKAELKRSCDILDIPKQNIFIEDRSEFPDDPKAIWDKALIASVVGEYIQKYKIETIYTFDEYGVSGHINHRSLYQGVQNLVSQEKNKNKITAFGLISTSILRKYISLVDLIPTILLDPGPTFVGSWTDMRTGFRAMYAHQSQFVWFRMLYITFARYMVMNSYREITP